MGRGVAASFVFGLMSLGGGCATPPAQDSIATSPAPAETAQRAAAEADYRACLATAARYVDDGRSNPAALAAVAAPLCYAQFSALEALLEQGQAADRRRALNRAGDQRQLDLATAALAENRSRNRLAATQ